MFTSYLARIGWRGRSSARLESWWPHTRTSLGLFPRCSRSAALLQDGWGGQKEREKEQRCLVEFAENVFSWLSAPLRILWTFHPEMFIRLVCCRCILTLGYPLFYPIKNSLCYHLCEAPSERPSLSNTNQLYFLLSFPMKRTENGDPFQYEMSSIKFRS